ncbi:MAG: RNA polymerase sigma factor [Cytophagaceae bacterium]|nr:RNA polymerase sigma factor [Cytophagaceae bacterium]
MGPKLRPTDLELINRIGKGDQTALEEVYKIHRQRIQQYVIRNSGTLQDAQDLYQEVILAFYRNVTAGRLTKLSGKLSTYLYKLAKNQWCDQLRLHEPLQELSNTTDYPTEEFSNEARQDAFLRRMIDQLDERCRRILLLYYFERLSMRDVAEQVGLPNGESAKKRKCDCLQKLKKLAERHREVEDEVE